MGLSGIWLRSGFCESSISSLVSILPCFEHSMQTVSLAPSISALIWLVWIFRPQTSHRTGVHPSCVYYVGDVYSCRIVKRRCMVGCFMDDALLRIRSVANYQFGKGVGVRLFPENVEILYSKRTGRIRYVTLCGERLATLRPTDGLFSLSLKAAGFLAENVGLARCFVTVRSDVSRFVADGGDVFAVHVVKVDDSVHAKDEVIVVDEGGCVLAVGRAVLSSSEMLAFKTGVAVKVRHGVKES